MCIRDSYNAVQWAVKNGITGGTSATTFSPDAPCTRAQAVTFLWRAAGSPAPSSTEMPFADVPTDAYYRNAVLWAVENGITGGTSTTTFSPDAPCSRGQIVAFLWRSKQSPMAVSYTHLAPLLQNHEWAWTGGRKNHVRRSLFSTGKIYRRADCFGAGVCPN